MASLDEVPGGKSVCGGQVGLEHLQRLADEGFNIVHGVVDQRTVLQPYRNGQLEFHVHLWIRAGHLEGKTKEYCVRLQGTPRNERDSSLAEHVAILPLKVVADIELRGRQDRRSECPVFVCVRESFQIEEGVGARSVPTIVGLSALDECPMIRTKGRDHVVKSRAFPARFVVTNGELGAVGSPARGHRLGSGFQDGEIPYEVVERSPKVVQDFADDQPPVAWTFGNRDKGADPGLLIGLEFLADFYRFLVRSEVADLVVERFDLAFCPV